MAQYTVNEQIAKCIKQFINSMQQDSIRIAPLHTAA